MNMKRILAPALCVLATASIAEVAPRNYYGNIAKRLEEEQKKNKAIADGVQSLLRESIVENYNRYSDKGFCPIYAKESIKRVYQAYSNLGGNDVAHELYQKILKMPEEEVQ